MEPPFSKRWHRQSASTTVCALLMLFVLSLVGANVLLNVTTRYNGTMKTAGWQEAMQAAEAGADIGLTNVRWLVNGGTANTAFASASSWVTTSGTYTLTTGTFQQSGQGPASSWVGVTVDAPAALKDSHGLQWYRIRASGYSLLPGFARVSDDTPTDMNARHNNSLRKFSFRYDRFTGATVSTPRAIRRIEVIAQPKTPWNAGVVATQSFSAPGTAGMVDSYDSSNSTKSTGGMYDASKRQVHGDVICNTGNISFGGDVYGNVGTNGGNIATSPPPSNIHGLVDNDTYIYEPPLPTPTWTVIAATPTTVTSNTSIVAGTVATPINYKFAKISQALTITLPGGQTTGAVNIWIPGDGSGTEFSGSITIPVGVTCKLYIEGDISLKASDINNLNNNASYFQIYGLIPASGNVQQFTFKPSGGFYAAIYAPYADIKFTGNVDVYGGIVGANITGNGNTSIHYDEALHWLGDPIDYRRASFIEDER